MRLQRVGMDENPQRCSLLNGPLRAWSKEVIFRVFHDVQAYVSCRKYDCISLRVWETMKQGGTAVIEFTVLDYHNSCDSQGLFYVIQSIINISE